MAEAFCKTFAMLDTLREPERFFCRLMRIAANESYPPLNYCQRLVALENYGPELPSFDLPEAEAVLRPPV